MSASFLQELKRRNGFRDAAIYVVVSWLLMQIGGVMFPALRKAIDYGWIFDWHWYINNPNLDSIRDKPAFRDMVSEMQEKVFTQSDRIRALPNMGEFDLRN